jgi:hypothetical protein
MIAVLLSALIPIAIGMIWYSKFLFGNAWMQSAGLTQEMLKGNNMVKVFGLAFLFSLLMAMVLWPVVIHQMALGSLIASPPYDTAENKALMQPVMDAFQYNFRTFKHGAFHGFIFGLFVGFSIVGMSSVFERRSWKYVLIHVGYWVVSCMLMGGVISAYA